MRTATVAECHSPEANFVASIFDSGGVSYPWSPMVDVDVAICVGPVGFVPAADARVLVVLGPVRLHVDMGYDCVVLPDERSIPAALQHFGRPDLRLLVVEPPVLEADAGRRMLPPDAEGVSLFASPEAPGDWARDVEVEPWNLWGRVGCRPVFSSRAYNGLIKGGAVGFFPCVDGYSVQIRRHFLLGGDVRLADGSEPDEVGSGLARDDYADAMRAVLEVV